MASINLTLPDEKLQIIERERAATGETQSEFLIRLLDAFEKGQKEAEMVAQYKRGYELYPETDEETSRMMESLMAAQMEVLSEYPWDGEDLS